MRTEYRVWYEAPVGMFRQSEPLSYDDARTFAKYLTGPRQIVSITPVVIATFDDDGDKS